MNSFFAQIVIVMALIVVAVTFPAIVYSTTCQSNPCRDNPQIPCVPVGRGTRFEDCGGSCIGLFCACKPKSDPKNPCECKQLKLGK